jgi:tripartite ATP-independent transporter DctM subunit
MTIEWPILLVIFFGALAVMMFSGMPVAFGFLVVNIIGVFILWGGFTGLDQLIFNTFDSISHFNFIAIPMFVLMGEIMFRSGTAMNMIDTVDKWMGRIPGRLSLVAVASGTIIATLTGAAMASVAMLGSALVPEMQAKGYHKSMILGPILGSAGLAILIPPSSLAVVIGSIGDISIGKLLISIIMPGLMLAAIMACYIIIRCAMKPSLAPAGEVKQYPLSVKLKETSYYVLPIAIVVFLVIGVMMLGVATPTEAAVTGALGTMILAAIYKKFNYKLVKDSLYSTLKITCMIFMMIVTASTFSQVLAFSGATVGLTQLAIGLQVPSVVIVILMQVVVLILGCFIDVIGILMIVLPIFMPIVNALHIDPVWFGTMLLINVTVAGISPPFGMVLFVLRSVTNKIPGISMGDIYRAGAIYSGIDGLALALVLVFPVIAMWLPGLMRPLNG